MLDNSAEVNVLNGAAWNKVKENVFLRRSGARLVSFSNDSMGSEGTAQILVETPHANSTF